MTAYNSQGTYGTDDFYANEIVSTEPFYLAAGESVLIDLYYNGSDTNLEGTLTANRSAKHALVTWNAGEGYIGSYDADIDGAVYVNHTSSAIYEKGEYLREFTSSYDLRRNGYNFVGWRVESDAVLYDDDWSYENYISGDDIGYYDYRVDKDTVFAAVWGKIVPFIFDANGERFAENYDGVLSNDRQTIGSKVVSKAKIRGSWTYYDPADGTSEDYWYSFYPEAENGSKHFQYWSLDRDGAQKVEWDDDGYLVDGDGNYVYADEAAGLTLYANWSDGGSGYDDDDDDDEAAIEVYMTTDDEVEAGNTVSFRLEISNTTDEDMQAKLYTWFYEDREIGGVSFGTVSGSGYTAQEDAGLVDLPAERTVILTLTGRIPDTWDDSSNITVVVDGNGYMGQAEYPRRSYEDDWRPDVLSDDEIKLAQPIKLGETKPVTFTQVTEEYTLLSFKPDKTGSYVLESTSANDVDPAVWFYDEDREHVGGADDEKDMDFLFARDLTAGNTYYFLVYHFDEAGTVSVSLREFKGEETAYIWSADNTYVSASAVYKDSDGYYQDIQERVASNVRETAATCTTAGSKVYTAVFEDKRFVTQTKTVSSPALGHTWGAWTVTRAATATAEGVETRTCSRCGATETRAIVKAAQPITVKAKSVSLKAAKVKKKKQTVGAAKAFAVSNAKGTVSYKKLSGEKKITIASNGKVTVKKGLKKGTYKIKVQVTAAGDASYSPGSKTVTLSVKIK